MNEEYISKLGEMCLSDDIVNRSLTTVINNLSDEFGTGDLSVNGKFEQTDDPECVVYASEKNSNSFVHADSNKGETIIGTKGWCILSIALEDSFVKLSGDATKLSDYEGTKTTIRIGEFSYNGIFEVSSSIQLDSDGNTIVPLIGLSSWLRDNYKYFVNTLENVKRFNALSTEDACVELFDKGANMFYLPEFPMVGNQDSVYGGQIVTGSGNKSIESYAHAEGMGTVADGSYSHAEGEGCRAFGLASHAEGISCTTTGTAARAEGYYCSSTGNHSFSRGLSSQANGHCSFAFGQSLTADGEDSVALGLLAQTVDDCTFIWNPGEFDQNTGLRKKYYSKGWGQFCINPVGGSRGFWIGDRTLQSILGDRRDSANFGNLIVEENNTNSYASVGSIAVGKSANARGNYSLAVGDSVSSMNSNSLAMGSQTYAGGWASFAGGNQTSAFKSGSFSFGNKVNVDAAYSFGFGESVSSNAQWGIALGTNASVKSNDERSFVWSSSSGGRVYNSNGAQTFNICPGSTPDGDINKFYVGDKTIVNKLRTAFGTSCVATDGKSFALGANCSATGNYSLAGVYNSKANQEYSVAIGCSLSAEHRTAIAMGKNTKTTAQNQFVWCGKVDGSTMTGGKWYTPPTATGSFCICPEGGISGFYIDNKSLNTYLNETSTNKLKSFEHLASGGAASVGNHSIAIGDSTTKSHNAYSVAIGPGANAKGYGSIAHGTSLSAFGTYSTAHGKSLSVQEGFSWAYGENLSSMSSYTIIGGTNAIAKDTKVFVWSGRTGQTYNNQDNRYYSHGAGTFCICPGANLNDDPKKKFYIGDSNFPTNVIDVIRENAEAIKTILGIS